MHGRWGLLLRLSSRLEKSRGKEEKVASTHSALSAVPDDDTHPSCSSPCCRKDSEEKAKKKKSNVGNDHRCSASLTSQKDVLVHDSEEENRKGRKTETLFSFLSLGEEYFC